MTKKPTLMAQFFHGLSIEDLYGSGTEFHYYKVAFGSVCRLLLLVGATMLEVHRWTEKCRCNSRGGRMRWGEGGMGN